MRARGSDGHQNVLWSVNYSQVVREQVNCKKPDVFNKWNKQQNLTLKPIKNQHKLPQKKKASSELSETTLSEQWNSQSTQFLFATFFLLAAAWVDPGRSALQSAEQRCQGRYGRIHRFGCTSIYDKNMQEGHLYKQQQSTQGDRV